MWKANKYTAKYTGDFTAHIAITMEYKPLWLFCKLKITKDRGCLTSWNWNLRWKYEHIQYIQCFNYGHKP